MLVHNVRKLAALVLFQKKLLRHACFDLRKQCLKTAAVEVSRI